MEPVEILTKARELISDESRWTRRAYAKDKHGNDTVPSAKNAVCFCALGALYRASAIPLGASHNELPGIDFLRKAMGRKVAKYNDAYSHKAVVKAFDRAIALAREA